MNRRLTLLYGSALLLLPTVAAAQTSKTYKERFEATKNFSDYVQVFWAYASHIIFTLSVLTIITGGVVYIASAGAEERLEAAKEIIKGAIVSIVLIIISGTAIHLLLSKPGEGAADIEQDSAFKVLNNTSSLVIGLAGSFTVVMLMFNAFRYITAAGDEDKIASARRGLTYALLGLVICVTAFVIVRNVITIF